MKTIYILLPLTLAACGGGNDGTVSGFASATSTGIDTSLTSLESAELFTLSGTVHMVAGEDGDTFVALAGIEPGYDVGTTRTTNATFFSEWQVIGINDITGTPTDFTDGGFIDVNADVAASTVTGTDGPLSISGTLDGGTNIGGSVTYDGVTGALDGFVGTTGIIGAFHGNDADTVYSGGFGYTLF